MANRNPKPHLAEVSKATQWIKGDERVKAAGRKGGAVRSQAKKYSAQLRWLKSKGDTDAQIKLFVQRIEDPTCNIIHIQKMVDDFLNSHPEDNHKIAAMNTLIQLHRANFGDKHHNINFNVNVDVEAEISDIKLHIAEVIKE